MDVCLTASVDVALLGCGNVGTAFARLTARRFEHHLPVRITGALVRDLLRARALDPSTRVTGDAAALLDAQPSVIVELLGGLEPARTIVLEALRRGIPVVTANKTLLARCGAELREAARATETTLLYEAAVLAGVPFLGTFARRPHAASATGLVGIVNGTTNFIVTQCAAGRSAAAALADAQRLGYAEPDARQDLAGIDAAEKLAVLLQHFAGRDIHPDRLETTGIDRLDALHMAHAAELGGVIKPVILAEWTRGVDAFAGPAFVPAEHPLARVDGVENALVLSTPHGRVLLQGPGAGPDATAATVLDDVHEIAAGGGAPRPRVVTATAVSTPATGWMVTLSAAQLPSASEVADFLASFGVFAHRSTATRLQAERRVRSFLAWPTDRPRLEQALASLERACGCEALALRALEAAP